METIRTTINLPKNIIQKTKHRAIEHGLTLTESFAEALNLWLSTEYQRPADGRDTVATMLKELSGAVKLGITKTPAGIKTLLEKRYEKEMLS